MEGLIKELFKHRKIAIAIIQEYYSQIVDLYCYLGFGSKTDEDIIDDCISGYLTVNEDRNGYLWLWYYDGNKEGVISLNDSRNTMIIDNSETIEAMFLR